MSDETPGLKPSEINALRRASAAVIRRRQRALKLRKDKYRQEARDAGYPLNFAVAMQPETWDTLRAIGKRWPWEGKSASSIMRAALEWYAGALLSGQAAEVLAPADRHLLDAICAEMNADPGAVIGLALRWLEKCAAAGHSPQA